jgi:hypothetical protein
MRSGIGAAFLFALLYLVPGTAAAQDPEPPPPPPPPQAVPRSEVRTRDTESRPAQVRERPAPERQAERAPAREAQRSNDDGGARRREAPRETNRAAEEAPRARVPVSGASTASANDDDQDGARRRGAVRRPPSGDSGRGNGGTATGRAVPRSEAPAPPRDTSRVYVYPDYYRYYNRYYDPWGYGGYGLGYFYYSPWSWDPFYNSGAYGGYSGSYGGGRPRYSAYGYDTGSLKIKVKPRDAEVFVDGYFAGEVDDFDGIFQSLKLTDGGYRIEVRKPGFETLHFDVRVQADRTITYRGEMRPIP